MHKILLSCLVFLLPSGVFAASMDVVADIPSGTYYAPIRITLTPTEPGAKTFYSFKPDGYPNDAFLYTGSILLKHSSPLMFFSFVSASNESKIKQNNYIFQYASDIRFVPDSLSGSGDVSVVLVNSGTTPADIGLWYVQSESGISTIPEGTVLAPGERYTARLQYTGTSAIVLRSPDDDEKDLFVPKGMEQGATVRIPKKPVAAVRAVPRKLLSTADTQSQPLPTAIVPASEMPAWTSSVIQSEPTSAISGTPTVDAVKAPESIPDINQLTKVSLTESRQEGVNPFYIFLVLGLSLAVGWARWLLQKKQG